MTRLGTLRLSLVGLALLGAAWACQDTSQDSTAPLLPVGKAAFDVSAPPAVESGMVTVCKDTPAGADHVVFEFDVVVTKRDAPSESTTYFVKAGHCVTFALPNLWSTYSIVEDLDETPGWTLASVTLTTDGGSQELTGNNASPAICSYASTTGCVFVFHNILTPPPPPPPEETPCPEGSFSFTMNNNGDLVIRYDQFPAPNDNSYGINAVGWGSHGHTFGNLTGSDHAGFQLLNGSGTVRLSFNVDYLSAQTAAPSGYASLGVLGGDGKMIVGTADGITATTSLANNLNNINIPGLFNASHVQQFGSVNVLVNSPPTDPLHQTYTNSDPTLAGWDFHNTYFVTISAAKLAAIGFDPATWEVEPNADQLHNSPAKVCPTTSGTGGCPYVLKYEVKDKQVKVTVQNDDAADAFLTDLTLNWPSAVNGKLTKVKRDGDVLYDNPDIAGGTAHLTLADMPADQNKRKFGHTSSHVITFEFERNADKDLSHYTGTASFAECLLALFGQ